MNKKDYIITSLIGIYIVLLPLAPSTKIEWILYAFLIASGFIYFIEIVSDKSYREDFKENFKKIVFSRFSILFLALILIMTLTSTYSQNKIASLKESARFACYGYLYFLICFRVRKEQMHSILVIAYMFGLAIVSLIGIHDFLINYSKHLSLDAILNQARVKATLGHPNAYGAYIILALFPTTILALKSKGKERLAYIILVFLLTINLALTFSRNAWLAFAIGILLLTVVYSWKFIFLCVVPIIFVTLSPNILMRIEQLRESGLNEGRVRLWKVAEKMVSEHLFLGVGSGNYIYAYKDYVRRFPGLQIVEAEALPPHNSYIKAFTELGIVGAMVFLLFCIEILKKVFEVRNYSENRIAKFFDGYLISVICFFIMNCFDDLFFVPKVTTNFILFTSIAFSIGYDKLKKSAN